MYLQPQTVHQHHLTEITELAVEPETETKMRSAVCIQNAKVLFLAQNYYNKIPFLSNYLIFDIDFIDTTTIHLLQ